LSSSRLELLEYSEQPYFLDCKALLVTSLIHVSGAVTSVQTFIFTFIDNHQLDDVLILVTASTLIVSLVSVCLLDVCICYVSNNALSDFREIGFFFLVLWSSCAEFFPSHMLFLSFLYEVARAPYNLTQMIRPAWASNPDSSVTIAT